MGNGFLSERIRDRRLEMGLSQSRLAYLAGTTQQHISLLEAGKVHPTLRTLGRVLGALGLDLAALPRRAWALQAKIEGLRRYNAWDSGQTQELGWEKSLAMAGALASLRAALAFPETVDWRTQAEEWARWRSLLPRRAPG